MLGKTEKLGEHEDSGRGAPDLGVGVLFGVFTPKKAKRQREEGGGGELGGGGGEGLTGIVSQQIDVVGGRGKKGKIM